MKLNNIPKHIDWGKDNSNQTALFESELLDALELPENEKSIVELLWGDIQLGKRVHACIIMWISIHIFQRPVLYVFRNLGVDRKQLQDDIIGTEEYNFNIQFIKTLYSEFNAQLQSYFGEDSSDYWKTYKIPEMKDLGHDIHKNKLSSNKTINPSDIFCCLMNNTRLNEVNVDFSKYIVEHESLVNITLLVDESDLMSPTATNDVTTAKDLNDSAECERLLAKIYKKVKYALHITGTAHSLLYNTTTRLSDSDDIQIKISKVHKMVRVDNYFGLFNNGIKFEIGSNAWWKEIHEAGS